MGAKQRKHPATAAWQSHISLTSGAQSTTGWSQLCHQPAETVWMIFLTLHFPQDSVTAVSVQHFLPAVDDGGFLFVSFVFPGRLNLKCECMKEMIHLMSGTGKSNM